MGGKQSRVCSIMQTGHSLRLPAASPPKMPGGNKDGITKEELGRLLFVVDSPVARVTMAALLLYERDTGVVVMLF